MRSASDGLLNLVGLTCVSPATKNRMHGIPSCWIPRRSSQYEQLHRIGPSAMRLDATIFLAIRYRPVSTFSMLAIFSTFRLFDIPTMDLPCSPSYQLMLNRPLLVASNAPSDTPEPLFTSDFHRRCHKHRCRPIPISGEEILAFLELRTYTCSTNNLSTWQRGLCMILLANGMQTWYAQCAKIGNEGITFFVFLWAGCHGIAVAIPCLIVNAKS